MGSLILLFAVTLSVILFASFREIRKKNLDMLERYAETYTLDPKPPAQEKPEPGREMRNPPMDERHDYEVSTFYAVALAEDGSVLKVDTAGKSFYEEGALVEIAGEVLAGSKLSGRSGNLTYAVSRKDGVTLVAFMDNTVSEAGLRTMLRNVLTVGGAALILLFFISLRLSNRIIQPLEENDRKQKQFVSDASHELKTPVAVIGANAELLSRELGENEWLNNIRYENERMGGLVRQLLELSRAENADVPMETVDLSRLVTGEALAFESLAFEKGKLLKSEIEDGVAVSGNVNQLTQLVSILLDNALRHSTGEEIELRLTRQGHVAELSVSNDGAEIPPEKQARIFDRFYRLDEARSGEGQHYGLGLSIAKAVAEKHGGSNAAALKAVSQKLTGAVKVGSDSILAMELTDGSTFEGSIDGSIVNAKGETVSTEVGAVSVTLDSTSTWTLTGDSYVTEFHGDAANVITNGYTLYVGGTPLTNAG